MRCSVWRMMGKQQQALRWKRVIAHQRNCHQCRSSQLSAHGAARIDPWYLHIAPDSKAHFLRVKPRPGCRKTWQKIRLLLAKYVDGWRQTDGKRKDILGGWVIWIISIAIQTNAKHMHLKTKSMRWIYSIGTLVQGNSKGAHFMASSASLRICSLQQLNHSAHGQHLIPNNNMALEACTAHVLTSTPSSAPL